MKKCGNWQRYVLEWGVLAALVFFIIAKTSTGGRINPDSYCPFGGLQAFVNYVSHGSLPCDMNSFQIISGIALVVAVVLFSKLFCAFLCPLGTISDLLIKWRKHMNVRPVLIPTRGSLDKILRIVKYVLLFVILYSTMATGELLCKRFDPYYAMATGFRGELTLWISLGMLFLLVLGSFFIDNFWCRYVCPLGAVSNTCKYWLWVVTMLGVVYMVNSISTQFPVWCIVALICSIGYMFEIFSPRTSLQVLYVHRTKERCDACMSCEKKCPYHINITGFNGAVEDVDCMLCGECVANCPSEALNLGFSEKRSAPKFNRFIPAILTVVIVVVSMLIGKNFELPTINQVWGTESTKDYQTFTLENLSQVHCYASSKSFMGKLQQIEGVHGVRTYVQHHRAEILFDPDVTTSEKIREELYVSANFQISAPDHNVVSTLRVVTIRTEKMTRSNSVNLLGLQFKQRDSLIYGLSTEWDMPLIVKMYVDPAFDKDEDWIRNVVNMPFLEMENAHTGKITKMPLGFEFVRMEHSDSTISTVDFLHMMFKPFVAEFKSVSEVDSSVEQFLYEIPEKNVTKPIVVRQMPLLASYLSGQKGIGAVYTCLNDDCKPTLVVRFYHPMTADGLYDLLSAEKWSVQEKEGAHSVLAPFKYVDKGIVRKL